MCSSRDISNMKKLRKRSLHGFLSEVSIYQERETYATKPTLEQTMENNSNLKLNILG